MNLYEKYVLPKVLNCTCGSKPIKLQREKIIPLAQGKILEIGIGSGSLILSILKERKFCFGVGIDKSKNAIKVAKYNANLHQVINRINFIKSDVDNFKSGKYDLIISNPPYIDKHKLKYLGVSAYEPDLALNGGVEGIEIIKKVFD